MVFILFTAVLIKGLTVTEKFQRMQLSQEEVVLLDPNNDTKLAWAKKLGDAIQFPTVSRNETDQNVEDLQNLASHLKTEFSGVFT